LAFLGSITLDDKDGNPVTLAGGTGSCELVEAHGLIGVASIRDSRRVLPQQHGGIDESKFEDGRLTALVLEVAGSGADLDAAQVNAFANFRTVTKPAFQTLKYGASLLKWTEGATGNRLQRRVKLADTIDPPINDIAARLLFQLQLYAEDPRAYDQVASTASSTISGGGGGLSTPIVLPITLSPSAGGTLAVNNAGTRETPPVFRIYGQCTDPVILLVNTGERITLTGTINLGDYVEIDTQARTLTLNGVTSVGGMLSPSNTRWFQIPEGSSTLRLLAASYDTSASLYVAYRSAY
jgi:hypothetical protein